MAIDSRKYREYLHQTRSHPEALPTEATANSWKSLGYSVPLFIGLEWYFESSFDGMPSGIAFPFGFLLFWALFYTQLKPTTAGNKSWGLKINWDWLYASPKPEPKPRAKSQPKRNPEPSFQQASPSVENALPREIENALGLLGLKGCRDWKTIHKRYRELAKKFHPDLNPDLTTAGNRFMIYDGAYRRLTQVKDKYFSS